MIKPNNEAALEFLEQYEPGGPWVLTCISTDRKGVNTSTFDGTSTKGLVKWLTEHNGSRNIYFHVNPTTKAVKVKARREHIKSLAWLHVDIDPRAGEDLDEERERCKALLTTKLPKGVPVPTCVLFSGGGYQAFWKLEDPLPINGEEEAYEQAKLYNLQLELAFDADNCHNVDRIMRLPGTINIPDAKKKKKGRTEQLAKLLEFDASRVYPLSEFTKAKEIQSPDAGGGLTSTAKTKAKIDTAKIERVLDLNELDKWDIKDRTKVIIAQGNHPDQPKGAGKDSSRSAWLFEALCGMARKGVPAETMYAIVTDPEWAISESVIELKGNAPHKYAMRQITRAIEYAKDPMLEEFNSKFSVIETLGGKCRVIQEIMDPVLKRAHLAIQSFADFQNRFMHRKVPIGKDANGIEKYMPAGKWWLGHEDRNQYEVVTFAPGHDIPGAYNLWKGFACDALPGECGLFLDHIKHNICQNNEEHFTYLMGWIARMIQQPDTPGEVAIVMRGGRGTGKSFFANQLGQLLGRHYLAVSNGAHLTGNFNSHLRDLVLLFADEAFYANDKKHTSILKTLITEPTLTIERKGVDVENAPNFIHLIMASNDEHVVPAGDKERRFFVVDVGEGKQQDSKYFGAIAKQMSEGGREALLHYLMHYDLSEYHVRTVPATNALREQQMMSLNVEAEWWYHKLQAGQLLWGKGGWPEMVVNEDFINDYVEHTRKFHSYSKASETILGAFIKKHWPYVRTSRPTVTREVQTSDGFVVSKKERLMVRQVPTLDECRQTWEELYGGIAWSMTDEPDLVLNEPPEKAPF